MKSNAKSLKQPYWVLIVDNDGMLADAYESIIERAGGKPLSVGNSNDAIMVLRNKQIDAVLLDLQMPTMDGMRLLEWMYKYIGPSPVRVVLTNHDNPKDIIRAYELGADRYVLKVWASPNDLIRVLNAALEHNPQDSFCLQQQN